MRERSRSPDSRRTAYSNDRDSRNSRDSYSRRESGYQRGRYDRRGGDFSRRRGAHRGRDFISRRNNSYASSGDDYKLKTERNYDNSIFIGNIPFGCSSKDVEDIFKGELDIVRADIVTNRGQSRGMATVEFSNKNDVRKAIDKYDHYEFRGREIFVRQDYPPPSDKRKDYAPSRNHDKAASSGYPDRLYGRAPPSRERFKTQQPKPGTEIFVGNLPFSVNWQALKDLMREAGEVVRADVRTDRWGKSRGFGTVIFNTEEEAARAVEQFQGYEIDGRKLDTRPGRVFNQEETKEDDIADSEEIRKNTEFTENVTGGGEQSNTIYTESLPLVTSVDDLYELFETIGKVTRAELQYDDQGKPSGNAVVEFETEELAELAISNLDNYNYGGHDLSISFAKRS